MKKEKKIITSKRRSFIKKAGLLTLGAAGASVVKAPYAYSASNPITWRELERMCCARRRWCFTGPRQRGVACLALN